MSRTSYKDNYDVTAKMGRRAWHSGTLNSMSWHNSMIVTGVFNVLSRALALALEIILPHKCQYIHVWPAHQA